MGWAKDPAARKRQEQALAKGRRELAKRRAAGEAPAAKPAKRRSQPGQLTAPAPAKPSKAPASPPAKPAKPAAKRSQPKTKSASASDPTKQAPRKGFLHGLLGGG